MDIMTYTSLNRKIRDYFLRNKLLDDKTINSNFEEAETKRMTLVQLLVNKKIITEDKAMSILAVETNLPPLDLDKIAIDHIEPNTLSPMQIKSLRIIPISKLSNTITLATANPFALDILDKIRNLLRNHDIRFVIVLEEKLNKNIDPLKEESNIQVEQLLSEEEEQEEELEQLTKEVDSSPIINLVNKIILNAVKEKASDIHIEPIGKKTRIRYRIFGALKEVYSLSIKYHNVIISRIKVLCGLDIAERRVPQDGKFTIKYEARNIDFRVSTLPSIFGEKCVMRILDSQSANVRLESLGFDEKALNEFRKAINAPYGMVLVTGPTGSGKSTTLYAALNEILSPEENITTIEDPVEYQIPGITQVPVNPKRGLTFAGALRSILRQDPDIILIGEIRDAETADIAIKAALTGHLVLSTLHINDASSTILRLINMGVESFLVATSLLLASAQRLLKKLCPDCKEKVVYPEKVLLDIGLTKEEAQMPLYKARGCSKCHNGYIGRFAILETLPVDEDIKNLILLGKSPLEIKRYAIKEKGMKTLRRIAIENALKGLTSLEEVVYMTLADK